ncbi:MAG TPA: hypothetical protein VEI82_07795 [Myxococcota bacterium]|nr:hypothetical protein [Myxococcota bacterium]
MADLRARFESFREARERARLEHAAGRSAELRVAHIDGEYGDVASGDALPALRAETAAASFANERELRTRFALGIAQAALASQLADADAQIEARRRAGAGPEELDELRSERIALRSRCLARLGFASARAYAEALRPEVDFGHWAGQAARLLALLEPALRDAEGRPGAASRFETELSAAKLRPALDFALEGLGLALERAPALAIDAEPRAGKWPHAFAGAPRVPGDVWLVYAPSAGASAHGALFAAAGAALHACFTSPALPLERRCLGDPALPSGFGEIVRALLREPTLGAALAGVAPEHFAAAALRARLEELARASRRVRDELVLAELAPGEGAPELGPPGFLAQLGPALSSVDELRAACLGTLFASALRARFGREYWKVRRAGELLKELWSTGTTYGLEALGRELELPPFSGEALLEAELAR